MFEYLPVDMTISAKLGLVKRVDNLLPFGLLA